MSRLLRALTGAPFVVLSFASAVPALAEAAPDRADITVTARRAAEAAEAEIGRRPGGVDQVAASDYADTIAISLRDALAFSPGVYAQPRFGQEIRLSVRGSGISRGFHMRGLTLLQDGIPFNLADDNGDFQELDPQAMERIEVYRGANALRFGGSTLGGAINAVTPTGRTAPRLSLRIDGGAFDTLRTRAAAGFATDRGDGYAALSTDRSDGDRDHARRDALRFNANAGLKLGDRIETRFYAMLSRIDQDLPGALTRDLALATPRRSLPANIVGDQERDIDSIRLQNRTRIDLGAGALVFGAFYNARQLFHPIFQVIDQQGDDRDAFASLDWAGTIAGMPWSLTIGSQARFGTIAARQYLNVAGRRGTLTADARQTARTINSYGEARLTPLPRLTLIAGGIHTSGRRAIDNRLAPARGGAAAFDAFSPKLGLLYAPDMAVQLYANYSRAVELPGFGELSQIPADGSAGFVDVRAQRSWTIEIGTRGARGIAAWDISLYRADLRGEMLQFAVSPDIPAATFNADRTRHQGIEAGLDIAIAPWARLRQVYQLNDFRFRDDPVYADNRLPVVPRQQYRAELRLGGEAISLTPRLEWVPHGAFADYHDATRAPGYALFGLGGEALLRDGITLFVDARNLTGRKAIGDISAVIAATPASAIYYPVERRGLYGGVRAAF